MDDERDVGSVGCSLAVVSDCGNGDFDVFFLFGSAIRQVIVDGSDDASLLIGDVLSVSLVGERVDDDHIISFEREIMVGVGDDDIIVATSERFEGEFFGICSDDKILFVSRIGVGFGDGPGSRFFAGVIGEIKGDGSFSVKIVGSELDGSCEGFGDVDVVGSRIGSCFVSSE